MPEMTYFNIEIEELPLVSVITPSVRPLGLKMTAESLKRQSYQNIEWLICMPEKYRLEAKEAIDNIFPYKFIGNPPIGEGKVWDLNYSYNRLIKSSHGKIIVTLQDWIYIGVDGVRKFVDIIEEFGDVAVSGVGNQFSQLGDYGKPECQTWNDPRINNKYGSFYEIFPQDFEWNWGALKKNILVDVGGFCEELDSGFGMDGYQVNERLDKLGYKFYIDQDNVSMTLRHNRDSYGGQDKWDGNNNLTNGNYEKIKEVFIKKGEWPKMKYLSID